MGKCRSFLSNPLADFERFELLNGGREGKREVQSFFFFFFLGYGGRLIGLSLWGGRDNLADTVYVPLGPQGSSE